ncbi:MAG: pyridoxal-dependent decarboxylase [Gammaproteobacteria bacterium]|nr:pyridoxal-dependent decarboxylase [Gammaproteobacteria bacterium]
MAKQSTLFPNDDVRRTTDQFLVKLLQDSTPLGVDESVSPAEDLSAFRRALSAVDFSTPQDLHHLLQWTVEHLQHGLVQMTHPRYFGLFNPAPSYPAECADRIAAAFNPQICVWSHAPVAVDIERHVIEQVAQRAGLPEGSGGHFTCGGSEANHTAVSCALTAAHDDFAEKGVFAFAGQPRIYASAESHLAWVKIAHQTGIGRKAVRLIDTDGSGRMCAAALARVIETDRAGGSVPVLIASTAGTTNAGMVDPLHACADIAKEYGLWHHVDAAWGGALIASERYRTCLDGIARADSVTIDAHKWFATTMGTGMFLTPHRHVLQTTFRVATSYMPSNDQAVDYYVNSMQWSRRFIGLRLFLALANAGWQGFADHVERGIRLMERLTTQLDAAGWQIANASSMAVACLIPPPGGESVEECVARIVASGQAWVSVTQFESQPVVRICITNGRTSSADIDALIRLLRNQ